MSRKSTPEKPQVDPSVKAVEKVDKDQLQALQEFKDTTMGYWQMVARELEALKTH